MIKETTKIKLRAALAQFVEEYPEKPQEVRRICSKIAEDFGVDTGSLCRKVHRHFQPRPFKAKTNGHQLMTDHQEEILVGIILGLHKSVNGLTGHQIMVLADALLFQDDPNAPKVSSGWLQSFLSRHDKQIGKRIGKPSDKDIDMNSMLDDLHTWSRTMEKQLAGIHQTPALVFNADETRATPRTQNVHLYGSKDTTEMQDLCSYESNLFTIITFVSAAGNVAMSCYIFKDANEDENKGTDAPILERAPYQTRSTRDWPTFFAKTDSGYMNASLWVELLHEFAKVIKPLRGVAGDLPVVLWVDGASMHKQTDDLVELQEDGIHTLFFPSNTSHFIQPLDGAPFANFKNALSRALREAWTANKLSGNRVPIEVATITYHVERNCFSSESLIHSFKTRGIYPFDPLLIIQNFLATKGELRKILGRKAPAEDDRTIKLASAVVKQFVSDAFLPKSPKTARMGGKNTLHTVEQLAAAKERKEKEIAEKAAEKQKKLEEKNANKLKKQEEAKKKKEIAEALKAAKKAEREAKKEAKLAKKLTSRKAKTETDAVKNTTSGKKEQVEVAEKPQLEDSMAEEPVQNGKKKRKKSFQEDLPPAKRIATPNCSNCGSNILSIKNMRPCPQHADFFLCTKCRAMDELLVPHLKCSEQRVRRDAAARAICMLRPTA